MAMASPRETGASDLEYDLISVIYHLLQGNETLTRYEQDANEEGDREAAQLFHDVREDQKACVERLRRVLSRCMGESARRLAA